MSVLPMVCICGRSVHHLVWRSLDRLYLVLDTNQHTIQHVKLKYKHPVGPVLCLYVWTTSDTQLWTPYMSYSVSVCVNINQFASVIAAQTPYQLSSYHLNLSSSRELQRLTGRGQECDESSRHARTAAATSARTQWPAVTSQWCPHTPPRPAVCSV
jgi:hypothetical protein